MTLANAELAAGLRVAVMRLRRRLANEHDPEHDLSIGSMAVLGGLYRLGGLTLGELAERERVRPPSMTRTINHLADGGYVSRVTGEHDRRQVIVSLTDRGRAAVLADRRRRDAWLSARLGELTPEERDVLRAAAPILEKLAEA